VEAFLGERIRFGEIFGVVESTLTHLSQSAATSPASVGELLEIDREAREIARARVAKIAG
jgi:1-deoxy-D-xylulose 5-phosphate reductoisomerase